MLIAHTSFQTRINYSEKGKNPQCVCVCVSHSRRDCKQLSMNLKHFLSVSKRGSLSAGYSALRKPSIHRLDLQK